MRGDEISQEQHSLRAICMEAVSLIPDGIVVKDGSRLLFEHHLSSAIDIDAFCCGFTPELHSFCIQIDLMINISNIQMKNQMFIR